MGSFDHRSLHDVLPLTLMFTAGRGFPPDLSEADALRTLVASDVEWFVWCERNIDLGISYLPLADWVLAARTFRWLMDARLLDGSLDETLGAYEATSSCCGVGASVGVARTRRLLHQLSYRHLSNSGTA
ncbi:hypothetical protein GCM10010129_73480 [Streptomyces fumigatiscleroticus]|nr:hypothetical protein GCM10010129_73480 [Streptomyces fumigatiscleroticus]